MTRNTFHSVAISLLLTRLMIFSTEVFAQSALLSAGADLALPGTYYSSNRYRGTGTGGSLCIEFNRHKHISTIVTIGYLAFGQKELSYSGTPPTTARVKAFPLHAGIKYYPQQSAKMQGGFFTSAEVGAIPTSTHFDYATNPDFTSYEYGLSTALGIGYRLKNLETGFRLQYNLTVTGFHVYYYHFRAAYCFRLRKNKQ